MKRYISTLLCNCLLLSAFAVLFAALLLGDNPFADFDRARRHAIDASLATSASASAARTVDAEERCIVKFKDGVSPEEIYDCVSGYSYATLADSAEGVFLVGTSAAEFRLKHSDITEYAEDDGTLSLSAVPNDPLAPSQWELESLEIFKAWNIAEGVRDVTVAVLDSGIYRAHPDFENVSILAGYDAVLHAEGVNEDVNGHGTEITSIIAAAADNGKGMAGAASGVAILPVRISDEGGYIHSSDFIEAVYYAADAGADVINMSFGGYTYSAMEEEAIRYADAHGCILVSAAGNGENDPQYSGMKAYPASYNGVISVGAVDKSGALCAFSQRNDAVDLVAPGADVTVADVNDGYRTESGTSFASAYISAAAALCLSAIDEGVGVSSDQLLSLIARQADGVYEDGFGFGRVSVYSLLEEINTPLVAGVADGGVYHSNVTVTFNRGEAELDGKPFKSGDSVIISGSHTLSITDGRNTRTVEFITDNIPLKYEYSAGVYEAYISFDRGSATLDGAPYLSGSPIRTEGRHCFKITGPYGNTESFDFECSFKAPDIFGVENGGVYTKPVRIMAGYGGVLRLNGVEIPADTVVDKSGSYTLVSSTADGRDEKTVFFTVSLPQISVYDTAVSGAKIAADDENGFLLLYNDVLSGARVFDIGNLSQTKCFVRTQAAVMGHCFCGENLVLIHENGASVLPRAEIAAGSAEGLVYRPFERAAAAAAAFGGYVYYASSEGDGSEIWRLDAASGRNELVTTVKGRVKILASDDALLAAVAENGQIYAIGADGRASLLSATGEKIRSAAVCGDYLCTDRFVYATASGEKLFSLLGGETVLFAKNGVLVTDMTVYDLPGRCAVGSFAERLTCAEVTDTGLVFKTVAGMRVETVNNGGAELDTKNAAAMLGAAEEDEPVFGEAQKFSDYESYVTTPDSLQITSAAVLSDAGLIVAVSATQHRLYVIDKQTLQPVRSMYLRFTPSSVCCDGDTAYVSFSDGDSVYCVSGGGSGFYTAGHSCDELVYSGGAFYALAGGDIFRFSKGDMANGTPVIRKQGVISFACDGNDIYAYLKPSSIPMIYRISAEGYEIMDAVQTTDAGGKLLAAGGMVFWGGRAFYGHGLKPAYRLPANAEYADGRYVLTSGGLYSVADGALIGDARVGVGTPMFDKDYRYYSFEEGRLCAIDNPRSDLTSLPNIGGVSSGGVIEGSVTPKFDYGIGYLDGVPYESGTLIENGGMHTLTVSLPFGVSETVNFTINAVINFISLSTDKFTVCVNETARLQVTATPYTYGAVEVQYKTDNKNVIVLDDGSFIGVAAGSCVITATTVDGRHKAELAVTVTPGALKFDSSYFYADSDRHIVRGISPGTDIDTFFASAADTVGDVSVRGYNGVEVSSGMIHTGMKAELYNMFGEVIDSWLLSVTGDVDEDGYVTANDYFTLKELLASSGTADAAVNAASDIDGNGDVNDFDLLALKEHFLGNSLDGTLPTRTANAAMHAVMPRLVAPGTSFTLGLTITGMKSITAVSGLLKFNSGLCGVSDVRVYGKGGFYSVAEEGVYFYTSCEKDLASGLIFTASFTVDENVILMGSELEFSCTDIVVYDGSAAVIDDASASAALTEQPPADVKIFELPDYVFDGEQSEYSLLFPAGTASIHVSAYPKELCDVAGQTSFGTDNKASFAVVVKGEDGTRQYDFKCAREEGEHFSTNSPEIFKNSNASLSSLTVEGAALTPDFDKAITSYYAVCADPALVKISAEAENENATVEVSDFDGGAVTVTCTAEDGTVMRYTLNLCARLPVSYPEERDMTPWLWLFAIPAFLVLALGCLAAVRAVKKRRKKKQKEETAAKA